MAQQQPVFVTIQSPIASATQQQTGTGGYKERAGKITGGIQIACGIVSIIFGVAACVFWSPLSPVGWPIWGGVLYIVSGSLGLCTRNGRSCLIVAYMVMSILSAVLAGGQVVFESFAALVAQDSGRYHDYEYDYDTGGWALSGESPIYATTGMNIGATLIGFAELVAAIVGSAYCCQGVCGTSNKSTPLVVQYTAVPQPGQNYPAPSGVHMQYPQPGAQIQYPKPGAQVQYPQPGAPVQYPHPGAHVQYPPLGAPMQIPPQGAHVQYSQPGAPVQYAAPGTNYQYPPPGAPPEYEASAPQDKADI